MKLTKLFIVGVLAAGLLAGCGHRQGDWQKAQQQNTVAAYRSFIKKYPNSDQAQQAQRRISEIKAKKRKQAEQQAWQQAQIANTQAAYTQYLQHYSKGPHAAEARQSIQSLQRRAWARARSADSIQALQSFISHYPDSPQARQARAEIGNLRRQQQSSQSTAQAGRTSTQAGPQKQSAPQGDYQVQLAAFRSQSSANSEQKHLQTRFSDLLGNSNLTVKKPPDSQYYRLKTTPMSQSAAKSLCNSLKQRHQSCYVVKRAKD